jgi:hypothetical protein
VVSALRSRLRPAAPPLLVAIVAASLALWSSRRLPGDTPRPRPTHAVGSPEQPCGDDVIALLGGMQIGDTVDGFRVRGLQCTTPRTVSIELSGDAGEVVVQVAATGALPHSPPLKTERCSLFYSQRGKAVPAERLQALLEALGGRVRAAESDGFPAGW